MTGEDDQRQLDREERLTLLQRTFADALVRGDESLAAEAIGEAIEASFGESEIDEHIVAPALRLIGDLWAAGELGVADEHLATEISMRVLTVQREAFRVARRRASHRVLLAAVQGEQHVIGLRMAASVALHAGFDVRMLGADVPLHALEDAILRHDPSIVGLTATMPGSGSRLIPTVELVGDVAPGIGIVIGGAAVTERFELLPSVEICRHVTDVVGQLEALAQRAQNN